MDQLIGGAKMLEGVKNVTSVIQSLYTYSMI